MSKAANYTYSVAWSADRRTDVIYVRVSTEEQVAGTSLSSQNSDCRAWCGVKRPVTPFEARI